MSGPAKEDQETPPSSDNDDPPLPLRKPCQIYRTLRDTKTARAVKRLYDYQCQLCRDVIELRNGDRYAESHHIKPLGDDGPDVRENILCVCPTCHAKLHCGVVRLGRRSIKLLKHHLDERYIDYHNTVIYRSK